MKVLFDPVALEHYIYWQTADKTVLKKINRLIKECQRHSFDGAGKPEPLKGNMSGNLSRRITDEHRLVYRVKHDVIEIIQCRYHY